MTDLNRRNFLKTGIALVAGVAAGSSSVLRAASPERKMTIDLVCGALGIRASQVEAVDLAQVCPWNFDRTSKSSRPA